MARRIAILLFEGCQSLDVFGPLEVFYGAHQRIEGASQGAHGYQTRLVGLSGLTVRSESGAKLSADLTASELLAESEPLDTLVVPGGSGVSECVRDRAALALLAQLAARARRITSVCTGAFMLGASGLLHGRSATTHWAYCEQLGEAFPGTRVDRDALFVRDDPVWTSAGVTAGIDLALALVEDDLGHAVAGVVAKQLVVFLRRSGSQAQLSPQLALQTSERLGIRELASWATQYPGSDLSVPALARRCGMSVRNFARLFHAQVGTTPAQFVERLRTDHARRLLESSTRSIDEVAAAAGFANTEALRRAFKREQGESPNEYRARLRTR